MFIISYIGLCWAKGKPILEGISDATQAQLDSNVDSLLIGGSGVPLAANEYVLGNQQQQQNSRGGQQFRGYGHPIQNPLGPQRQYEQSRQSGGRYDPSYYPSTYRQDRPMWQGYYPNHQLGNNYQYPYYSQYNRGYPTVGQQRRHFAHGYYPYYGKNRVAPSLTASRSGGDRGWFTQWF